MKASQLIGGMPLEARSEFVQLANEEGLKIVKDVKADLRSKILADAQRIKETKVAQYKARLALVLALAVKTREAQIKIDQEKAMKKEKTKKNWSKSKFAALAIAKKKNEEDEEEKDDV